MAKVYKPRKNTKSYKEFTRLYKNLAEQSRYYKKLGVDLPDVRDAFKRSDANYKNLQQLKKFRTAYLSRVKQVKRDIITIRKTLNVSTSTAYKIYSKETNTAGPLKYEDVVIANFKYEIMKLPNLDAREKLMTYIQEYEKTFEDRKELADILEETANEDKAFEALHQYLKPDVLAFNLHELMESLTARKAKEPLTQEFLFEVMDALF